MKQKVGALCCPPQGNQVLHEDVHVLLPGKTFFQDEDSSQKGCLLLGYLLQCLRKCFLYDKGSFLSKERFETLLKPLVDQV